MADDFKVGEVVQLKSGGPKMTIGKIGSQSMSGKTADEAKCSWFDEKNKIQEEWFQLTSLKRWGM
jgi:uncharacterized protein YodC (DUF2158 family)